MSLVTDPQEQTVVGEWTSSGPDGGAAALRHRVARGCGWLGGVASAPAGRPPARPGRGLGPGHCGACEALEMRLQSVQGHFLKANHS